MNHSLHDLARRAAQSITTLNRELRELQAEYDQAPTFSFSRRMKPQVAEEIVRVERRKAAYVKTLNELNMRLRSSQRAPRAAPRPADRPPPAGVRGWKQGQLQQQIDALYQEIGALGARIGAMDYTPERKQLIQRHKDLIRQRRALIDRVHQGG